MAISSELRKLVFDRAAGRCEYCGLAQAGQEATFHVDHIVPVSANGPTEFENLALACVSCSLRKGAREFFVDPESGVQCRLFQPRTDLWNDHFLWDGPRLIGRTPTGRATVEGLQLNRPLIIAVRDEESHWGRHP